MNRSVSLILFLWIALMGFEHFFIRSHTGGHTWETIKGFHILLGFASGLGLMLLAKFLGHFMLHRPDNYYKKSEGDPT